MAQYRIVQIDTVTNGVVKTEYVLQRKLWFTWLLVRFAYCQGGTDYTRLYNPARYHGKKQVTAYVETLIRNHVKLVYKGCRLIPAIHDSGEIYWVSIDLVKQKRRYRNDAYESLYAFADTIENLKKIIDEEKPEVKVFKKIIVRCGFRSHRF